MCFFMLSCFSLTLIDFHGTLHLALYLVNLNLSPASLWMVTQFLYLSFGVRLSDVSSRVVVSCSYHILIAYIPINKWGPVIMWNLNLSYFCIDSGKSLLRQFCNSKILPFKRRICLIVPNAVYLLHVYEYII